MFFVGRNSALAGMSSIDALWSELKEEEHRMRRTPKASAGVPSFTTHLAAPPDNATIATAGIAGELPLPTPHCAAPDFCSQRSRSAAINPLPSTTSKATIATTMMMKVAATA